MVSVKCADGMIRLTKEDYDWFVETWNDQGMAEELISRRTEDELRTLYDNTH